MGSTEVSAITVPASAEFNVAAKDGQVYKIQVAWPMNWQTRDGHENVSVMSVVPPSAYLIYQRLTRTDILLMETQHS